MSSTTPPAPAEPGHDLVVLARLDLRAAEALAALGTDLSPVVLFHAQQCAEKLLKAFLTRRHQVPPRTHALGALLDLCVQFDAALESVRADVELLAPFAVAPRYVLRPISDLGIISRAINAARRIEAAFASVLVSARP